MQEVGAPQGDAAVAVASSANPLLVTGTDIAAGDNFSCALMDARIRCWGANPFGQLGDDTTTEKWAPVLVHDIEDATALGIGEQHACTVRTGGTLSCWGRNSNGQLGDNSTSTRDGPVAVSGLSAVTMVEGGLNHTCAVEAGDAFCWGNNGNGKLGDNTTTQRLVPVSVHGFTAGTVDWVDPGDSFTCAVASASNTVYCWGLNANGQLGIGNTTEQHLPQSTGLTGASRVSAGAIHACAIVSGGVKCWGNNGSGRLGDGTTSQRTSPVDVKDAGNNLLTGIVDLSAGASHTCAVKDDGAVLCWGLNANGQLGSGNYTESNKAKVVPGIDDAVKVSAGQIHTCVMRETGQATCFGHNANGRLGDGFVTQSNTPVPVSESCGATRIAAGDIFSCAVESLGQVACWGSNSSGQLGIGGYVERWSPVTVHDLTDMTGVSTGGQHACAVGNGSLYCWGANYGYQLGEGTTLPRTEPRPIFLQSGVTKPDTDCTYSEYEGNGYYFCRNASTWTAARDKCRTAGVDMELARVHSDEENEFLAAGLLTNAWLGGNDRTTEGQWRWAEGGVDNGEQYWQGKGTSQGGASVGGLYNAWVDSVQPDDAGGADCLETDINGNWFDTLCTVTKHFVCKGAPVAAVQATVVSADEVHSCALDDTGDVWCWGTNATGQIGDGSTTTRKLPVKTSALPADATDVNTGDNFTCAVLMNATAMCWGGNANSQLGDGTTTQRTSPTNTVGNLTDPVQVSAGFRHACAVQADGKVKCWGLNTFGQLGNGNTSQQSEGATVLVTGTTDPLEEVSKVAAGHDHTCALQTTGDVWCWGYNLLGRIGDGTQTNRNKAVPVTLPEAAVDIATGLEHTCAALVTGETWCWGANGAGKLGNGTATYSTVPVATTGLECIRDLCPTDPAKVEPGACGCGNADTDSDGDTVADCVDGCPADMNKTEPLECGCGNPETDTDGDTFPDCVDGCPDDVNKTEPLACDCGFPETDADSDTTPDCAEACPSDSAKTLPGVCGCGETEDDTDSDTLPDCADACPTDGDKMAPEVCGCLFADTDTDLDTFPDCIDNCPDDDIKQDPGTCGCSVADTDTDDDTTPDCIDNCPNDPLKTEPGVCGCDIPDDAPDCDACPADPTKTAPGICGCGVDDALDTDEDGSPDCVDGCVDDPVKTVPGFCGCGVSGGPDNPEVDEETSEVSEIVDSDGDDVPDCADGCPGDSGQTTLGECGCASAPEPVGTACSTGFCVPNTTCDGAGSCGSYADCSPPGEGLLSTGFAHSCTVREDGEVWCWGANNYGQLGDGSTQDRENPVRVANISDAVQVSNRGYSTLGNTCALHRTGRVSCWGFGGFGSLGTGVIAAANTRPRPVIGVNDAVQISVGGKHTCVVRRTGRVACWGQNNAGQLGDGSTTLHPTPVEVSVITDAIQVTAGDLHTCALLREGTVSCWGSRSDGRLGDGEAPTGYSTSPVAVSNLSYVSQVSAGWAHSCAVSGGEIKCWGLNASGQLGDGSYENRLAPILGPVLGLVAQISAGLQRTCAMNLAKASACWGGRGGFVDLQAELVACSMTSPLSLVSLGASEVCLGEYKLVALDDGKPTLLPTAACLPFEGTPRGLKFPASRRTTRAPDSWRSRLYPYEWSRNYEDDQGRHVHDFSYAGYRLGEVAIPNAPEEGDPDFITLPLTAGELSNCGLSTDWDGDSNPQNDFAHKFDEPGLDSTAFRNAPDATPVIQACIDYLESLQPTCQSKNPQRRVLLIPEGTYRLAIPDEQTCDPSDDDAYCYALGIECSGIVLRGAGRGKTRLIWDRDTDESIGGGTLIAVDPTLGEPDDWRWAAENSTPVDVDGEVDATSTGIPLVDVPFVQDDWIVIKSPGALVGDDVIADVDDPTATLPVDCDLAGGRQAQTAFYLRQMKEQNGNSIDIDIPIRHALKNGATVYRAMNHLYEVAVEDMSFSVPQLHRSCSGTASCDCPVKKDSCSANPGRCRCQTDLVSTVYYENLVNGWFQRLSSYGSDYDPPGTQLEPSADFDIPTGGITGRWSRSITIRDSVFGPSQNRHHGGGNGLFRGSDIAEVLVDNCVGLYSHTNFGLLRAAASGNVFRNTLSIRGVHDDMHMKVSHANLLDNSTLAFTVRQDFYDAYPKDSHRFTGKHNVYWNTRGLWDYSTARYSRRGYGEWLIDSRQLDWGLVIGTHGVNAAGPISHARVSPAQMDPYHQRIDGVDRKICWEDTSSQDLLEGEGRGHGLYPQSVYADQLVRRLNCTGPSATCAAEGLPRSQALDQSTLLLTAGTPDRIDVDPIYPHDDTYVERDSEQNLGDDDRLHIEPAPACGTVPKALAYLQFHLSTVSAVRSATLRMTGRELGTTSNPLDDHPTRVRVRGLSWDDWGEGSVTWSTRPPMDATPMYEATTFVDDRITEHSFDVTSFIASQRQEGYATFVVLIDNPEDGSNRVEFFSKEYVDESQRPVLLIDEGDTGMTSLISDCDSVVGPGNECAAVDNDPETAWAWSASYPAPAVLTFSLGGLRQVKAMDIAFKEGDRRATFIDIYGSTDNQEYDHLLFFRNSGTSTLFERIVFPGSLPEYRYIQIRGYGNFSKAFPTNQTLLERAETGLTEVQIYE